VCLAFLRFVPAEQWSVLLVSIRDEDLARPASPPHEWWPDTHPGVLGGRDLRAGGTWLAVDPANRAVAAIFTPAVTEPTAPGQPSRGALPLHALTAGGLDDTDVRSYAPFALLLARPDDVVWWTWSGTTLDRTAVDPGTHIANIDGLDAEAVSARQARWREPFAAAAPVPFRPDGGPAERWGGWFTLLAGGLEPEEPDALVLRRTVGDAAYGTKSVALLALGQAGVRYDESSTPWDPDSWTAVR
jgi:hypothetical protein